MDIEKIEEQADNILKKNKCFTVPIDIEELAINIGIKLDRIKIEDDVSGLFVMKNGKPYILYNSIQSKNRTRFTIAHELGHYILHSYKTPLFIDKKNKVLFRDNNSSTGEILMEREANAFAAALLMPKNLIRKEVDNKLADVDDIIQYLADKFQVSSQAMSFRLSNLGYDFGMF